MSRVGLKPIPLPSGVEIEIEESLSIVKGPKGELRQHIPAGIEIKVEDGNVVCSRPSEHPRDRSNHGLVRALIANQVKGVSEGFSRELTIVGVGYRAELKGRNLVMNLGYSHPIEVPAPEGITFEVPEQTKVVVKGSSKQVVGQIAAEIRDLRPPEPYKGKGVRYADEKVQRKAGKSATKA
ncbi:MAG TPA: 50S ribosomal protein L6 [Candidatus Krumholzibacteria bacterium]|nr:50S ribosomal protein L6 [Candidatus Krumholzibacteria bacterium]